MQITAAVAAAIATFVLGSLDPVEPQLRLAFDAISMIWHIERERDPQSRPQSCAVVSRTGEVVARLEVSGQVGEATWTVRVGLDTQPGSLRYLRVERRIFTTDRESFRGAEAGEIVALLKAPGEFAFEWAARPDFAKRVGLFSTGDFAVKAALCEDWIGGPRI